MKLELIHKDNQRRLLALDQCLRSGGKFGVTRQQIMIRLKNQGFPVSTRSFNRDISKLRDLGAPTAYEYKRDQEGTVEVRWFYNDPTWTMSEIPMTEGTLFALLVSQRVMEQFAGLPMAADLQNAFNIIADSFNRKVAIHHDALVPISFSSEKVATVDPAVWTQVAQATMKRRRLKITYKKGWNNEEGSESVRHVNPCHIVNLQGNWYLLATASLEDNSLRQYALSHITNAKALQHNAELPDGFDIKKILGNTFGQFIGDPDNVEEIHVRFKARVAPLVLSRHFSALEKKTVQKNGDIDLRFPASPAGPWPHYHIRSWVLSWGADVEVIGPDSLRTAVRDEIEKMTQQNKS